MSLGKSIRKHRIDADLKQKDLAERLDVTTNYMSLVENDRREPSLSFIKKVANELKVPVGILFFDDDIATKEMPVDAVTALQKIKELMWQIEKLIPHENA